MSNPAELAKDKRTISEVALTIAHAALKGLHLLFCIYNQKA